MALFTEHGAGDLRDERTREILEFARKHHLQIRWIWDGRAGASTQLVPEIVMPMTASTSSVDVNLQNLLGARFRR